MNGTTNGHGHGAEVPVTKIFASFVADASTKQLTPDLRTKIKEVIIDYIGVVVGGMKYAESSEPIYNAVVALQGKGNRGNSTVLGKGKPHMLPQYAALLNSAFGHSWDFDDTYADGVLHAGITAISASMTQAELLGESVSGDEFMLAISVGYEVTCRLSREIGTYAYDRGFHNTGTAGIFGAVAAIAVLRKLSAEMIEMAFGIAGSKAAGSLQFLENGSWNKRLNPGFAVHDAFVCVELAEAGVIGATKIFEGKMGFLKGYSSKPKKDLEGMVAGLGSEWVWMSSSLKPYPACRWTHGLIEMAGDIHSSRTIKAEDIQAITLTMSPHAVPIVGERTENKLRPLNNIDAQFSAYFQAANALLYGSATGIQAYRRLDDPKILALCSRTTVDADPSLQGFATRLRIHSVGGKSEEHVLDFPLGETQRPFTRDKVDEKFMGLARGVYGASQVRKIIQVIDGIEGHQVADLIRLLR
ncbi:hypothetical protein PRZ48_007757 [Zasmidium cellare]|uniref:MmgE/PrpD family protein n=1 Tax=Zasmidium cellare TaxID=395010 RepID=A0ABR0EK64_ZASCE|nr:hypothetical protein PRZ48_007757 [Zasmidium cellare]